MIRISHYSSGLLCITYIISFTPRVHDEPEFFLINEMFLTSKKGNIRPMFRIQIRQQLLKGDSHHIYSLNYSCLVVIMLHFAGDSLCDEGIQLVAVSGPQLCPIEAQLHQPKFWLYAAAGDIPRNPPCKVSRRLRDRLKC